MAVAVELVMPRLSESMEEGTIVSWLVGDGAPVASGQEIAEIETDKATLPYEAPESGVLRILVPEGTTLPLGSPIGLIDDFVGVPAPVGTPNAATPGVADLDPPTESFEVHPDLVDPRASAAGAAQPVASSSGGQEWSPAWGPQQPAAPQPPQPAGAQPQRPVPPPPLHPPTPPASGGPHVDEGETTEFDAIDPSLLDAPQGPAAPQPPDAVSPPPEQPLPDPSGNPWVSTPVDDGRYAAEDLIAPPTLAPRPPAQQPAPAAGAPRIVASPVARRLASELGIDLSTLTGSGPEGRIVRADIEAAQAQGAARPPRPASAAPSAASEFTPPVDEARAAAPIPAAEPEPVAAAPEPEPVAEPESVAAAEPAPVPAAEPDPVPVAAAEPEAVAESVVVEPEPAVAPEEPVAEPEAQAHDPREIAEVEAEADIEADAAEVVAIAGETARSIDADDEADVEPELETVAEAEPAPAPTEARILPAAQPGGGKGEPEIVELTRQQATVARRMAESKATIPDFHTTVELDAGPLLTLRADVIATRPDLAAPSVNDLLVKAVAIALRAFPRLNGAYKDGRIEQYPRINVGIATESSGALVVPVIHDADTLSVSQIASRTDEILAKAADGGLRPPDIASATFTVSNLGMHGVDEFTAVITPGQAAILTAGAITERPVVRNGAVVAGQTLRLTLTTDHRAVYGLQAAEFLGRVRQLIEHPSSLLA